LRIALVFRSIETEKVAVAPARRFFFMLNTIAHEDYIVLTGRRCGGRGGGHGRGGDPSERGVGVGAGIRPNTSLSRLSPLSWPELMKRTFSLGWRGRSDLREDIVASVRVEPLTDATARLAGEAIAHVKGATVVDAIVRASAALRGDLVYTSDAGDLELLRAHFPGVRVLGA
jgi:hypothetical protein